MPKRVILQPAGKEFIVEQHETILEAGLRHGLNLPYSCANGTCGDCRSRLLHGSIEPVRYHDFRFTPAERNQGWFLTCSCRPLTDVEISLDLSDRPADIPQQRIATRVSKTVPLNRETLLLELRTPRSRSFRFLAGQKARLTFGDCFSLILPVASCPCDGIHLRFHLRTADMGPDDCWQELLKHGQRVTVQGPCGEFVMDEASKRPLLFIAWERGFAQIQSLVEHAISIDPDRTMRLYWLSPQEHGHYMSNYCRSLEDALDDFSYRPVGLASIARLDEVIAQILSTYDLQEYDLYMTLPHACIARSRQRILDLGVPERQLFIDSA
jgi:CDP-4-dehydro-6-deoxyglucose reductase